MTKQHLPPSILVMVINIVNSLAGNFPAVLLGLFLVLLNPGVRAETSDQECVVLLHGLDRTGLSMKAIEWKLEHSGYRVANVSYPSWRHAIEDLSNLAVEKGLAECRRHGASSIHFVTHSLGR